MTQPISVFRQGLIALVPIAEAVAITWRDENMYDDWERLQDAQFTVLVEGTIRGDIDLFGSSRPFARYDFNLKDCAESSWVEVAVPGREAPFALVRLQTTSEPFDTVGAVHVEADGRAGDWIGVPWTPELHFRAQLRDQAGGELTAVESVTPTDSVV